MGKLGKSIALALVGGGLAALAVTSASGQADIAASPGDVIIYRDSGYRGPAVAASAERPNLGLAWPVNSVRVAGGVWQLCSRPHYRGSCRVVVTDTPVLGSSNRGITVQSMRRLGGGGGFIGVEAHNQVLRGKYSEFHTEPDARGYRIPACPTGTPTSSCTAKTANNYCRSRGWQHASRSHGEVVGRRTFLGDVVCENNKG